MSYNSLGTPMASASKPIDDQIMERWKAFFKATDNVPEKLKNIYAMGKLVQLAVVQYIRLRGVCEEGLFIKRRYNEYRFFSLNPDTEEGAKLSNIIRAAGSFITASSLKTFRVQLLHNPEKPEEVGEELCFLLHYGDGMVVNMDFGNNDSVELNMRDCSFESFLYCFGEIIGKIRCYCAHLTPLPRCEKRFRISFYKKLLPGSDTSAYKHVTGNVEYAPNIQPKVVGAAILPGIAAAAILRTCYSSEEIDEIISENVASTTKKEIENMLNSEKNLSEGGHHDNRVDFEQDALLDDRVSPSEVVEAPIFVATKVPAVVVAEKSLSPNLAGPLLSPECNQSLISFEAIMSPFPREQVLINDSVVHAEPSRPTSTESRKESAHGRSKVLESSDTRGRPLIVKENKKLDLNQNKKSGLDQNGKKNPVSKEDSKVENELPSNEKNDHRHKTGTKRKSVEDTSDHRAKKHRNTAIPVR